MKIKNPRYTFLEDTSLVDCDLWSDDLQEWLPCTVPLDGSDEDTKDLANLILARYTHNDLNKVMVDSYLHPVTDIILSKEKKIKEKRLKESKRIYLNACAKEEITNGFYSDATGKSLFYSSTLEEQQNLTTFLLSESDCYIKCGSEDSRSRVLHTKEEVKKVIKDFNTTKGEILSKLDGLKAKLARVHADFSIEAIMWD